MKPGDRVRWAESHCRLEAMRARNHDAVYGHLRGQLGVVDGSRHVGGRQLLVVTWNDRFGEPHTLPAELLERAEP